MFTSNRFGFGNSVQVCLCIIVFRSCVILSVTDYQIHLAIDHLSYFVWLAIPQASFLLIHIPLLGTLSAYGPHCHDKFFHLLLLSVRFLRPVLLATTLSIYLSTFILIFDIFQDK